MSRSHVVKGRTTDEAFQALEQQPNMSALICIYLISVSHLTLQDQDIVVDGGLCLCSALLLYLKITMSNVRLNTQRKLNAEDRKFDVLTSLSQQCLLYFSSVFFISHFFF